MQRYQAAGTSRVNGHARSFEVKEPADTVRQNGIGDTCGLVF